jgi:hypothetical protein
MIDITKLDFSRLILLADFITGLESHTRLTPDTQLLRKLGQDGIDCILATNHRQRILLLKEVAWRL